MYQAGENVHESTTLAVLKKRLTDLFGSIASQRASLRIIAKGGNDVMIVRCSLAELDHVLAAIALCDPPLVTLDMSSSMKRLKARRL